MSEGNRSIFVGMQVLIEQKWVSGQAVVVEDTKIKAIIPADMIKHHLPANQQPFPANYYLLPGLIDLHIHGAKGSDVMDATEAALFTISQALAEEGVTGYLATTMTASPEEISKVLSAIAAAMTSSEGAAILGAHLEGPFIAKEKIGAQSPYVQLPHPGLFNAWQNAAPDVIKLVTLAPELPGALNLIQLLHDKKIIISIGHTDATYAETMTAIKAGCTQATHLFNAMRGLHQREPGAVGALLLSDEVNAELIVDGIHLHPAIVELVLRVKGKDRLLLVTDAMRAKCLGDGRYDLGGQVVQVTAGKASLTNGTLAGSTLRMPEAIKNMVQFSDCSLADAIAMASANPAAVLGLTARKGSITVGKDADLVVMNSHLDVMLTMREGKEVFCK